MKAQLELRNRALAATAEGVVIADARLPDNPIIYANTGFERLTGYSAEDVMGRNCRFLQGPGTDGDSLERLRSAIRQKQECTVQLLNYRKDGSTFWNRLSITPIRDAAGEVTHYIGVQSDITEQKRTEEALQAANRKLGAAAERSKQDLEAAAAVRTGSSGKPGNFSSESGNPIYEGLRSNPTESRLSTQDLASTKSRNNLRI